MIYTVIDSLLIKKTILFVKSTKLFISNSARVHRYICEIIKLYTLCSWGGTFNSLFCSEGSVFVHNDCPRGGFLLPSSCVPGVCPGGVVMDEIDTCILNLKIKIVILR